MSPSTPVARVATLNLFHWAEPGIGWYGVDPTHTDESWAMKRRWLSETLAEIDADVVALQEVVSVGALETVAREAGYPHVLTVGEPDVETHADGRRSYHRPVNALISKTPLSPLAPPETPGLAHSLGLKEGRSLRREPAVAEVTLPGVGPTVAMSLHLKSPGATVGDVSLHYDAPPQTPAEAARRDAEALSRSHAFATIQRMYEATTIRHAAAALTATAPRRPVIAMGDFNDDPNSPTLRAFTAHRATKGDAADAEGVDFASRDPADSWRLLDAYRLAPRDLERDERRPTHQRGARGDVIDFVLVSAALHGAGPDAVGRVIEHVVHDHWFNGLHPAITSDHAAVSATIAPL